MADETPIDPEPRPTRYFVKLADTGMVMQRNSLSNADPELPPPDGMVEIDSATYDRALPGWTLHADGSFTPPTRPAGTGGVPLGVNNLTAAERTALLQILTILRGGKL